MLITTDPTALRFVIRPAIPSDVQAIADLDKKIWQDWANPVTLYRQVLDLFPDTVLVGHSIDGRYAGCALGLVRPAPCTAWILNVDIAEEFRGQGLGRQFCHALLSAFEDLGAKRIIAIIDPTNIRSQRWCD